MKLIPGEIYHLYNRGNNRERLFYTPQHYAYFLKKLRDHLRPHCDILAYCLMPNHFHILIRATHLTIQPLRRDQSDTPHPLIPEITGFSRGLQIMLSSYTRAINKSHSRKGSLFSQNTKMKRTSSEAFKADYSAWCFLYIHQNPVKAGYVQTPENWKYSSYREYLGRVNDPLCNIEVARKVLSLEINELIKFSGVNIPPHIRDKFFNRKTGATTSGGTSNLFPACENPLFCSFLFTWPPFSQPSPGCPLMGTISTATISARSECM